MNNNLTIVTSAFVVILFFLFNPLQLWMPLEFEYTLIASLAVISALFAGLIIGEKARDEREEEIRAHAARAGYLAGVFVLTLSIVVTVFNGNRINEWILITLAVMVLVRAFVRLRKN